MVFGAEYTSLSLVALAASVAMVLIDMDFSNTENVYSNKY